MILNEKLLEQMIYTEHDRHDDIGLFQIWILICCRRATFTSKWKSKWNVFYKVRNLIEIICQLDVFNVKLIFVKIFF